MASPLVEAEGLGRSYLQAGEAVVALSSATLRIWPGQRIALVGRSGSGKSTLLHLLAGLDEPSSGSLAWPALGSIESLLPDKIALVFQAPSLLDSLSVAENVALPLLMAGRDRDSSARVKFALNMFGLLSLADKLPQTLSGGQMQCVAMARAIVGEPKLILADEPTGQLDQVSGQALLDALFRHLEGSDCALLIATHDPVIAARMEIHWQMEHGLLSVSERFAGSV
ncbi:ABC transporter ATP-binding protein [Pseudomonas sp. H11T01]|uniref:ABC transporter ATP-binding protein n=1 Tax=Pseudomonas sp. H11T01 TaxID=3402749 RepID=UPI003AC8BF6D